MLQLIGDLALVSLEYRKSLNVCVPCPCPLSRGHPDQVRRKQSHLSMRDKHGPAPFIRPPSVTRAMTRSALAPIDDLLTTSSHKNSDTAEAVVSSPAICHICLPWIINQL